jgi:hypothetical protein
MASKRYGEKAAEKVEETMHELKRGTLRSSSGDKVTSRKQAIAIGLSEARAAGGKVPPAPKAKKTTKKTAKKQAAKKVARKAAGKKKAAKKATPRKAARKTAARPTSRTTKR